ncbi:5035_t:CDS:2, partial [Racocetra fulgida]
MRNPPILPVLQSPYDPLANGADLSLNKNIDYWKGFGHKNHESVDLSSVKETSDLEKQNEELKNQVENFKKQIQNVGSKGIALRKKSKKKSKVDVNKDLWKGGLQKSALNSIIGVLFKIRHSTPEEIDWNALKDEYEQQINKESPVSTEHNETRSEDNSEEFDDNE